LPQTAIKMIQNPSEPIIKHVDLGEPTKTWVLIHALTVHLKNYPTAHKYADPKYESMGAYMLKTLEYYLANIMDAEKTFKMGAEELERVKNVEGNKKAEFVEMFRSIMRSAVIEFIETLATARPWDSQARKIQEETMDMHDPFDILDCMIDKSVGGYELWFMGSQGAMFDASEQRIPVEFNINYLELKMIHGKILGMTEELTGMSFSDIVSRQPILVEINGLIASERRNGRNKNTDTIAALLELRADFTTPEWVSGTPPMTITAAKLKIDKIIKSRQIPVFTITERRRINTLGSTAPRASTATTSTATTSNGGLIPPPRSNKQQKNATPK